ncbi:MAG: hypothetical protein WCJ70_02540 [bacterium]
MKKNNTSVVVKGLSGVRKVFGKLIAKSVILGTTTSFEGEEGILICTISVPSRGPRGGKASEISEPGSGFIDILITNNQAQNLIIALQERLRS